MEIEEQKEVSTIRLETGEEPVSCMNLRSNGLGRFKTCKCKTYRGYANCPECGRRMHDDRSEFWTEHVCTVVSAETGFEPEISTICSVPGGLNGPGFTMTVAGRVLERDDDVEADLSEDEIRGLQDFLNGIRRAD